MKRQFKGYGYEYSYSQIMKVTLIILLGMVAFGILYELNWVAILVIIIASLCAIPLITNAQYRYMYEQQRFTDATIYMEQMIYMFKKKPQVLYALNETKLVLSEYGKYLCEESIKKIEAAQYSENLYRESLHEIEEEYGCERLQVLHRFLFLVESEGGEYQNSINLLLDDLKSWIQRVYQFQKERKKIKNNITISIIATLVICLLTTKIFPSEYRVTQELLYQITTTIMILLLIVIFVIVQSKLCGTWLKSFENDEKKIINDYEKAVYPGEGKKFPLPILLLTLAAIIYGLLKKQFFIILCSLAAGIYVWSQPKRNKKKAIKRCEKEIKKAFPVWLRELALTMQRKPVSAAIVDSYEHAPIILKPAIKKMESTFETDLVSIFPYQDFLSEFQIPEVTSTMKMLYAINSVGREEMMEQIHALLERNSKLEEKSDEIKERDKTSLSGFLVVCPMAVSFVKLVTDMLLLITGFLEDFSNLI